MTRHVIGPGAFPQSSIPGILTMTQREEMLLRGMAFTQSKVLQFGNGQVIDFLVDASAYTPDPEQIYGMIVQDTPIVGGTAGPILVDFYFGPTVITPGTPISPPAFNRNTLNPRTAQLAITQGPTLASPGTLFSKIMAPATSVGVVGTPGSSVSSIPVIISGLILMRITNANGAGTYVELRNNWFEI